MKTKRKQKNMVLVSGRGRCGTSLMMHCLHKAGLSPAFELKRNPKAEKIMRQPEGFYEGQWNGESGLLKCFSDFERFDNPRVIIMTRDINKIIRSWLEVYKKRGEKQLGGLSNQLKQPRKAKKHNHIEVDYDTFVQNPEHYRKDFNRLFPELDYDKIKSGIDLTIYKER